MQSLSDDVRRRLLEKPCFELAAKGVFRLGSFRQDVPGFWAESDRLSGKTGYCTSGKKSECQLGDLVFDSLYGNAQPARQ